MPFEPIYPDGTVEPDQVSDASGAPARSEPIVPRIMSGSVVPREPLPTEPRQATAPTEPDEGTRKTALQARIDRLVRKKGQAETERDAFRSQLEGVTKELASLRASLASVNKPTSAPAPSPGLFGDAAEHPAAPAASAVPDISGLVEAAVQKALAPLTAKAAEAARISELRAAHEAVFAEIVEDFPELKDQQSELRKTFNVIFDSRQDLQQLPDAPAIVANIARGVLADQRRAEQKQSAAKRAASIHTPTPVVAEPPADKFSKIAEKAVEDARERMRAGIGGSADYALLRKAQRTRSGLPTE